VDLRPDRGEQAARRRPLRRGHRLGRRRFIDTPVAELRSLFENELARLLPLARDAKVEEFFVTREKHATFRQASGSAALRPGPAHPVRGLYLAGAWTATGWPDTMESAVRSGISAARVAQEHRVDGSSPH
jgi:uncharacterized protein with NAD-binding domain and iron-sulfur cluster